MTLLDILAALALPALASLAFGVLREYRRQMEPPRALPPAPLPSARVVRR